MKKFKNKTKFKQTTFQVILRTLYLNSHKPIRNFVLIYSDQQYQVTDLNNNNNNNNFINFYCAIINIHFQLRITILSYYKYIRIQMLKYSISHARILNHTMKVNLEQILVF